MHLNGNLEKFISKTVEAKVMILTRYVVTYVDKFHGTRIIFDLSAKVHVAYIGLPSIYLAI